MSLDHKTYKKTNMEKIIYKWSITRFLDTAPSNVLSSSNKYVLVSQTWGGCNFEILRGN